MTTSWCGRTLRSPSASSLRGALVDALRDPQPRVRAMAASSLGRAKSAEALESLIGALQDDDPLVRRTATVVLEGFDDPRATAALAQ
jgi:HEAT repeat protein